MKTYNVFYEDGRLQTIKSEKEIPLAMMQKIVGGYIEIYEAGKTKFIMNEEGRIHGMRPNPAFPAFCGTVISTQDGI